MYGLPSTSSDEFNPSCRAQLPSVFTMPKLDMSYQPSNGRGKVPSENGEGIEGELHSTTTTPLNYMRRATPTANPNKRPDMIQEKALYENSADLDMDKAFKNIHLSANEDFLNFDQNTQRNNHDLDNGNDGGNAGDACSEATQDPWNYAQSPSHANRDYSAGGGRGNNGLGMDGMNANRTSNDLNNFGELSLEQRSNDINSLQQLLHSGDGPVSSYSQQPYLSQHQDAPLQRQQQQHAPPRAGGYRVSPPTVGTPYQQQIQNQNQGYQQHHLPPQHQQHQQTNYGSTGLSQEYGHLIPPPLSMVGAPGPSSYQYPPRDGSSASTPTSGLSAPPSTRRSTPASTPTHGSYATASQTPLPYAAVPSRYLPQGQGQVQGQTPTGSFYGGNPALRAVPEEFGARPAAADLDTYPGPITAARTPTNAAGVAAGYHSGAVPPRYGEAHSVPVGPSGYSLPPQSPHHHQMQQQQQAMGGVGAAYHAGAPMMSMPMQQDVIYQVQFKRSSRSFTLSHRAGITVNERDFVVVEADRGEDIGVVIEMMSMQTFMERRMSMARGGRDQQADQEDQNVGCILRLATLHERQQLPDKFHTEKDVVQACNELAMYGFGLPIMVFEAEFQFDRRKLTIYYDCNVRIDFRDFVRQLYSTYKARIWMKKMSPNVAPDVQPFAAMALATGVQFSNGSGISFN